jgi:FtsH-binding integral membrane protein
MNIKTLSRQYMRQQLYLTAALFLIILMLMQVWLLDCLLWPTVISVFFTLVVAGVIGVVWARIAKQSPESLPTFFTAVSGFRLLLALAVMFVYYLVNGRDSMLSFFLVFMVFYFVSLGHHSIFFAKVSNRS